MKKKTGKGQMVTIVSLMLVFVGVIVSFFFDTSNEIIETITTITAVISAFAIYIQIRKTKSVGQASFTIEISKYFYEVPGMAGFIHKFGRSNYSYNKSYIVTNEDQPILIKYLNYIKTLATLVKENVVTIQTLNNVFAYEFFVVLNNKSVQDIEIIPFEKFYHDIFDLFDAWQTYRVKHGFEILHEEDSLGNLDVYQNYIKGGNESES